MLQYDVMDGEKNNRKSSMEWFYDDDGKPVSNFMPEVISCVEVYTDDALHPQSQVKFRLLFKNGQKSQEFLEPLTNLGHINWLDKDKRCRIYPKYAHHRVSRFFEDAIRAALSNTLEEREYHLNRLGTHIIEDTPIFCTGGGIIMPPNSTLKGVSIKTDSIPFNLDIDPELDEATAAVDMLELISLSPDAGRVILAQTLLYIMRSAYKSTGKAPCCCVFLYGETGSKKTTYSALLTQIYNRQKGIASLQRLNSSIPAAVAMIYEKNDCVIPLDDLFPAESGEIRHHQEETLYEVTRIIADGNAPARMRKNKVSHEPPSCGVLFTGEYIIGNGSDAARLLPIELSPSPDGEQLKRFQDDVLLVSTFYHFFISWYISHYHEIRDLLKEWRKIYSKIHMDVHGRLQETHFFLNTTYILLLQYCVDINCITEQNAQVMQGSFRDLLTELVQYQQLRVDQGKLSIQSKYAESVKISYLEHIRSMYKDGQFRLAEAKKHFDDNRHDGVMHYGCLCLRTNKFKEKFRKYYTYDNFDNVIRTLSIQHALKEVGGRTEVQIAGLDGKRFYAIRLECIK